MDNSLSKKVLLIRERLLEIAIDDEGSRGGREFQSRGSLEK